MPKYRVVVEQTATLRQRAEIDVEADNPSDAEEIACEADPTWRNVKVFDSDGWDVESVTEIKEA